MGDKTYEELTPQIIPLRGERFQREAGPIFSIRARLLDRAELIQVQVEPFQGKVPQKVSENYHPGKPRVIAWCFRHPFLCPGLAAKKGLRKMEITEQALQALFEVGKKVGTHCGPQRKKEGKFWLDYWWLPEDREMGPLFGLVYWLGCQAGFAWGLSDSGQKIAKVEGENFWELLPEERVGPLPHMPKGDMRGEIDGRLWMFFMGVDLGYLEWLSPYKDLLTKFFTEALYFTDGELWRVDPELVREVLDEFIC